MSTYLDLILDLLNSSYSLGSVNEYTPNVSSWYIGA